MTFLDLISEGQRLCQLGKYEDALTPLEKALYKVGSDKTRLRITYSYLGNVHYSLGNFGRAMEYHRQDLKITQAMSDIPGQMDALNNLSCALRMLGKHKEAAVAAEKQLVLAERSKDRKAEAIAKYNAGVVAYMEGRQVATDSEEQIEAYNCFVKAQDYLQDYLLIAEDIKDVKMQGQAAGCLGNTFYLLGNYSKALFYYRKRLLLAQRCSDQTAERRAYSNLALCHALLGQFEEANDYWKKFLAVALDQRDISAQGQAFYCLGNNHSVMGNYHKAAEYYNKHLNIAQKLGDKVGEGRAYWMLSNVYSNWGQLKKALDFARKFFELANKMEDAVAISAARMMMNDLSNFMGIDTTADKEAGRSEERLVDKEEFARERRNSCTTTSPRPPKIAVPEQNWVSEPHVANAPTELDRGLTHLKPAHNFSVSELSQSSRSLQSNFTVQTNKSRYSTVSGPALSEDFFELLHRHTKDRGNDQRSAGLTPVKEELRSPPPQIRHHVTSDPPPVSRYATPVRPKPKRPPTSKQENGSTPHRGFMPPITQNVTRNTRTRDLGGGSGHIGPPSNSEIWTSVKPGSQASVTTESEENFFQLLSRLQGDRMDNQRTAMDSKHRL